MVKGSVWWLRSVPVAMLVSVFCRAGSREMNPGVFVRLVLVSWSGGVCFVVGVPCCGQSGKIVASLMSLFFVCGCFTFSCLCFVQIKWWYSQPLCMQSELGLSFLLTITCFCLQCPVAVFALGHPRQIGQTSAAFSTAAFLVSMGANKKWRQPPAGKMYFSKSNQIKSNRYIFNDKIHTYL